MKCTFVSLFLGEPMLSVIGISDCHPIRKTEVFDCALSQVGDHDHTPVVGLTEWVKGG